MYICELSYGINGGCLFVNYLVAGFVLPHQGWLVSLLCMFVEDVSYVFGGVCLVHGHWGFFLVGCIRYVVDVCVCACACACTHGFFVYCFSRMSIMNGGYVDRSMCDWS